MREVTMYYAYNDKEFFNREKCLAYEHEALIRSLEIYDAYTFFDKNSRLIPALLNPKIWKIGLIGLMSQEVSVYILFGAQIFPPKLKSFIMMNGDIVF